MSNNVDMSNRSVGSDYSELLVVVLPFMHCIKVLLARPVTVLWMDPLKDHRTVRRRLLWIEAPNPISFFRPVVQFPSGRIVGRGARVAQSLRFGQISFAAPDGFFRNFALFDFYTRAIPFDDLSRFVAQWFFTMKEPAIFPVSPPHSRLANERLSGFKRRAPFWHKRFYIFSMDHAGPTPPQQHCYRAAHTFQAAADL